MIRFFKKRGFTDKLYIINLIFTWMYTLICLVLSVFGSVLGIDDYSFVSVVCPLIWAELSIHTGFIIWKAKAENMHKHSVSENITM